MSHIVSIAKSAISILVVSGISYGGVKYGAPAVGSRAVTQWTPAKIEAPVVVAPPPAAPEAESADAWTGVLLAQAAELATRFDGKISKVLVRAGDSVKAGDVLAELDTSTYKHELAAAEASLRASRAEAWNASVALSAAKDRQSRRTGSVKFGNEQIAIVSDEEASGAKFDSLAAQSRAGAAGAVAEERRARLEQLRQMMSEAKIRAPFDGTVAARYLDTGAQLRAGMPLLRIVGKGTIRVRFAVPEAEAKNVKQNAKAIVEWDDRKLEAVIDRVAPEVESASSTVFIEAEVVADAQSKQERTALAGRVVGVRLASTNR